MQLKMKLEDLKLIQMAETIPFPKHIKINETKLFILGIKKLKVTTYMATLGLRSIYFFIVFLCPSDLIFTYV